ALTRVPGSGELARGGGRSTLLWVWRARLDGNAPQRKPALELWLHGQFGGQLRLDLKLPLGGALLLPGGRHERVPEAALVVVDEVDALARGCPRAHGAAGCRVGAVHEGEHRAQQPLAVTGCLHRARYGVDTHREIFHAWGAVWIPQDHPAVAVAVVLSGHGCAAVAAGGPHHLFHVAQGGFELARGQRLKDDRGDASGLDLVLGLD